MKKGGKQPVSFWVKVFHEQVERERQERLERDSESASEFERSE